MTLGPTGVFWLPRTATGNSAALIAGTGPAPLTAAAGAWTSTSAALTDAALTVTRVTAELSAAWSGSTASAAQAGLTRFAAWSHATAGLAATVGTKAGAHAAAYTTALAVMPSLVEIAAVKATKTTAYATGGAAVGAAQAAEAADTALDVRAAMVMEAYESASAVLAVTDTFAAPPAVTLTSVAGPGCRPAPALGHTERDVAARPEGGSEDAPSRDTLPDNAVDHARAALDHPATTHAASVAQQVATTAPSTASSLQQAVASASPSVPATGVVGTVPPTSPDRATSGSGSAVAATALGGASGSIARAPAPWTGVGVDARTAVAGAEPTVTTAPVDAAATRAGLGAVPLSHHRGDDEAVIGRPRSGVVQFDDGVPVVPAVIGASTTVSLSGTA